MMIKNTISSFLMAIILTALVIPIFVSSSGIGVVVETVYADFTALDDNVFYTYDDRFFRDLEGMLLLGVRNMSSDERDVVLNELLATFLRTRGNISGFYKHVALEIRSYVAVELMDLGIPEKYIIPSLIYVDRDGGIVRLTYVLNILWDSKFTDEIAVNVERVFPNIIPLYRWWMDILVSELTSLFPELFVEIDLGAMNVTVVVRDVAASVQYIVGDDLYVYSSKLVDKPYDSDEIARKMIGISKKYPNLLGYSDTYGVLLIYVANKSDANPAGYTLDQLLDQVREIRSELIGRDDLPVYVVIWRYIKGRPISSTAFEYGYRDHDTGSLVERRNTGDIVDDTSIPSNIFWLLVVVGVVTIFPAYLVVKRIYQRSKQVTNRSLNMRVKRRLY